jgi:multisubunit Na+/H+ antiporter MnhF subunit
VYSVRVPPRGRFTTLVQSKATPINPTHPSPRNATWRREELLHLLSLSGTLAGLCITGVTLFHTMGRTSIPRTIADDVLAVSALLFLVCTYLIFFALRTRRDAVAIRLEKIADLLFLLALTGMVLCGFIMVYALW